MAWRPQYVRLKDGPRRYGRAALDANHTIKPDLVTVGGWEEKHSEGTTTSPKEK